MFFFFVFNKVKIQNIMKIYKLMFFVCLFVCFKIYHLICNKMILQISIQVVNFNYDKWTCMYEICTGETTFLDLNRFKQAFSIRWKFKYTFNFWHVAHVLIRRNSMMLWELLTSYDLYDLRGVFYKGIGSQ